MKQKLIHPIVFSPPQVTWSLPRLPPIASTFTDSLTHPPCSPAYFPLLSAPPPDGFYSSPAEKERGLLESLFL